MKLILNLSTLQVFHAMAWLMDTVVNQVEDQGTGFGVLWNIVNPNTGQLYNSLNVSNINVGVYNVTVDDFRYGCDVTKTFISQP